MVLARGDRLPPAILTLSLRRGSGVREMAAFGSAETNAGIEASMEPHPWLKPLSRRVGVAIACLAWLGFESYYDPGGLWFWLALGATAYAIWDFFLSGSYRETSE
jgi:hypothetical protein